MNDDEVVIEIKGLKPEARYRVFRAIFEAYGGRVPAPSCNISGGDHIDRIHTVVAVFEAVGTAVDKVRDVDLTVRFTD